MELRTPETEFVISRFPAQMVEMIAIPGAMVVFGFVFIFGLRLSQPREKRMTWQVVFAIGWTGLAFLMFVAFADIDLTSQRRLYSDYIHRRYEVVEGCLDGFVPSTSAGHTPDQIEVGGHNFTYSDSLFSGGFNTTEIRGGPIHADTWLRLFVVRDVIVRVDAIQHACAAAPERLRGS